LFKVLWVNKLAPKYSFILLWKGDSMKDQEYIDKLEELSFKFRDDNELCDYKTCSECKLNTKIKLVKSDIEKSYCEILASIYNASKDED
jgi:hypothetical protein